MNQPATRPAPARTALKPGGTRVIANAAPPEATHPELPRRPFGIGGSDVAALLGLSPHRTALELWADLMGRPQARGDEPLHLRFGRHAEPFVADEYERRSGLVAVAHPDPLFHRLHGFMFGHVDRLVVGRHDEPAVVDGRVTAAGLLECKTASAFNRAAWGEDGSNLVPPHYLAQCAWYMAVTGCAWADLAVLIGNSELRVHRIERDAELEGLLVERATRFWHDHVLGHRPPAPTTPEDNQLLFPRSQPGTSVQAGPEVLALLESYRDRCEESERIKIECEELRARVQAHMGEAEELRAGPTVLATWRNAKGAERIDTAALEAELPEVAARFKVRAIGGRRFLLKGPAQRYGHTEALGAGR